MYDVVLLNVIAQGRVRRNSDGKEKEGCKKKRDNKGRAASERERHPKTTRPPVSSWRTWGSKLELKERKRLKEGRTNVSRWSAGPLIINFPE